MLESDKHAENECFEVVGDRFWSNDWTHSDGSNHEVRLYMLSKNRYGIMTLINGEEIASMALSREGLDILAGLLKGAPRLSHLFMDE